MNPIRVLVVDDSTVIRRLLTTVIDADPQIEVVGTASDGRLALKKIEMLRPDLVTLDVEMPNLNGIETLREIRATDRRLPVIMFSTLTEKGASATIEALSLGASDYVTKPSNVGSMGLAIDQVREQLVPKIKALCIAPTFEARVAPAAPVSAPRRPAASYDVVAIGASTGGPNALRDVLTVLPADFPLPIVVTQHMPPLFTRQLADRLDAASKISVREASNGDRLVPGTALIAPGDFHLTTSTSAGRVSVRLSKAPPENFCRPSVDVMFRSLAAIYGERVLAVMLTGMGHDGSMSTSQLHALGAHVIAQDQETSVVWGMPGTVVAGGFADEVLPLDRIGDAIVARARTVSRSTTAHRPRPLSRPTMSHAGR